jgi:hypothetical protein
MRKLLTLTALALVTAAAFAFVAVRPNVAIAHEGEDHSDEVAQADTEQEQPSNDTHSFTAQAGDSYTKIARKAVQIYGINNTVNLSGAQIVAAETYLTREAGSPELNVGQKIELTNDAVKAAVEKAQGLDDAAKALWDRYVKYVDFNTNNVGESRA